jgi:hypothetical protein
MWLGPRDWCRRNAERSHPQRVPSPHSVHDSTEISLNLINTAVLFPLKTPYSSNSCLNNVRSRGEVADPGQNPEMHR